MRPNFKIIYLVFSLALCAGVIASHLLVPCGDSLLQKNLEIDLDLDMDLDMETDMDIDMSIEIDLDLYSVTMLRR